MITPHTASELFSNTVQTIGHIRWPSMWRCFRILTLSSTDMIRTWDVVTRSILNLLICTLLLGLAGGVVKMFFDLWLLVSLTVEMALRQILVDALTLLAMVEVLKTAVTYCTDGRVRVTYIVDTVLVVMLTEVISRWFTGGNWTQFLTLSALLLTLALIRIAAIRYTPSAQTGGLGLCAAPSPTSP